MTYFFNKIFAQNGEITEIPKEDQGDGYVSYEKGWEEGYSLDQKDYPDDSRNLSRTNFNGLFFNITQVIQQLQKYGVNPYITSTENGGEPFAYDLGGMCSYIDPETDDYGVYYSIRDNNTTVPSENGVTTKFWRRVFQADLDSIKSNRIYSSILYFNTAPSVTETVDGYTFTVYEDTKFLFSNKLKEDNSLKTSIVHFVNSVSKTVDEEGRYTFFATSNEDILVLHSGQISFWYTQKEAVEELGDISTEDCYYFNALENTWKIRRAETTEFEDLDYSLCLIGTVDITNGEIKDGEFTKSLPSLRILSEFEIDKKLNHKQNSILPGRHLDLTKISEHQELLKVKLPIDAMRFCVNSCNLDSNGDIDLLDIDATPIDVVEYKQVQEEYQVSKKEFREMITNFGTNGISAGGKWITNPSHAFGIKSGYCANVQTNGYEGRVSGGKDTEITFTFANPPEIQGEALLRYSYKFDSGNCDYGWPHRDRYMYVDVLFTDGTSVRLQTTPHYGNNGVGWTEKNIYLPSGHQNKRIYAIKFYIYAYLWCYYDRHPIQMQLASVQLYVDQIVWETRVKQETIEQWHTEWVGHSNKLYFKTGSNYLELLENPENATPILDRSTAKIISSISNFNDIWGSKETIVQFEDWWESFSTEYEFLVTPEETNNAKLFFRYNDIDTEGLLNNLSIVLTYWGGFTYTLCDKITLLKTQDVLLDIPDGKYIQKITITVDKMDNLGGSSFGMVNLYNNVSSGLNFVQYPAIYATSADGNKYFMLNNVPTIEVEYSGYVMLSESGAYILPGTNVIRRQKHMPTVNDEPRLTEGDIWLDIGSEPLRAYQYLGGTWLICNDVPVGYVTGEYLNPIATAETESETITQVSVSASTFKTKTTAEGIYEFTYTDSKWYLDGVQKTLNNYGISITGTPTEGDVIKVFFSMGTLSITDVEQYPINQNGYDVNVYTEITNELRGRDGRDGQNGKDGKNGKNGLDGPRGPAGIGVPAGGQVGDLLVKTTNLDYGTAWTTVVPTGGKKGEFLAKKSDSNFDTEWGTVLSTALMNGGRTGETLLKKSDSDLDFDWGTLESLPPGGSSGNALVKNSGTDYDVKWADVQSLPEGGVTGEVLSKKTNSNFDVKWTTAHYIPSGGNVNQALVKLSNNDYDYAWADVAGGGGDTDFIDMKINMFFFGQNNGYLSLNTDDFKTIDSIDTTLYDGADVVSTYWNEAKRQIYNSSNSDISYCFEEISQVVRGFYIDTLKDGLVTLQYSVDGGTTWQSLTEKTVYSVTTTSLLIKVTQPAGSKFMAISILLK